LIKRQPINKEGSSTINRRNYNNDEGWYGVSYLIYHKFIDKIQKKIRLVEK